MSRTRKAGGRRGEPDRRRHSSSKPERFVRGRPDGAEGNPRPAAFRFDITVRCDRVADTGSLPRRA
ncbi:MAG: hypothetical protein OXG81_10960 [Acidobacteria bacterium]|nr:hypothetical protein [Acidobacteriota bacterium]